MKKLLLIVPLAALLLSACFDYRESWVYGRDGTAVVHIVCALSKEFLAKNPELTPEKERFLLEPFWKTNDLDLSKITVLRSGLVMSNSHLALDIRLKGKLADLAALPFFRQREFNFSENGKSLAVFQRVDLGNFSANLPCDGTAAFTHVFPGDLKKANQPFKGRKITEAKKLSELSDGRKLTFYAQCDYPERWPWKETLYVALCFLLFFLFARHSRNVRRATPRDPAPIPGDIHSLPDLLRRSAALFSMLPAVRDVDPRSVSEMSFQTLFANANRLSHYLLGKNIHPKDRVALLVTNGRWRHIAVMGIQGAGGVALPLDASKSPEELAEVMRKHNVSFLILSETYQTLGSEMLLLSKPFTCVLWLREDLEKNILPECLLAQPTSPPLKGITREDPALLLTEGGKEILLTHGAILAQVFSAAQTMLLDAQDVLMTTYAPNSVESLSFTVFLPLATASCVIGTEKDTLEEWFSALEKHGVTVFLTDEKNAMALSNLFLNKISGEKDFRFRRGLAGALKFLSLPHVFLMRSLKERLGFKLRRVYVLNEVKDKRFYYSGPMYGMEVMTGFSMAETAGVVLLSTPLRRAFGASGAPLGNIEVKVIGPDGKPLKKGLRGRLCLRGPAVIKRYWSPDQTSRASFKNGWLITDITAVINKDATITLGGDT